MAGSNTEYTPNARASKSKWIWALSALALVFPAGSGILPQSSVHAAEASLSVAGPNGWDDLTFMGYLQLIYRILGGDPAVWSSRATSVNAAMELVDQQYLDSVTYPAKGDPSYDNLMDAIRSASCMLKAAPLSLDPVTIGMFLKTITCEWIDMGLFPGDLGC